MRLDQSIQLKSDASGQVESLLDSLGIACSRSFVDGDGQEVCSRCSLRNEEVVGQDERNEQPQAF